VCKGWTKRESANPEFPISNFNPIIQVRGAEPKIRTIVRIVCFDELMR